jgi:hypothetical protein
MTHMRKTVVAMATAAAVAIAATGCTQRYRAGAGAEAQVFATSRAPAWTSTVFDPTDMIVNFGFQPENVTGHEVSVRSVSLLRPSGAGVRLIAIRAYTGRVVPVPIGVLGDLPRTCPKFYRPRPLTDVTAKPRSAAHWVVIISLMFTHPGTYKFGVLRIGYETQGHRGWQRYYEGVTVKVTSLSHAPGYLKGQYICRGHST